MHSLNVGVREKHPHYTAPPVLRPTYEKTNLSRLCEERSDAAIYSHEAGLNCATRPTSPVRCAAGSNFPQGKL